MKLKLAKKKLFEGMEVECYEDSSRENGDFFMTRKQIGQALEYSSESTYNRIISRNTEEIGNPTLVKLTRVEGSREVSRDIELYSFNQLFQILRFSKQPKANIFMSWASTTLQELIVGRAELKFAKQEDEQEYKSQVQELTNEVEKLGGKIGHLESTVNTLIDNSTINSRQAQKLLFTAKDRVNIILDGAHSSKYKRESRTYFKNLWLNFCQRFETSSYKDLNPLYYNEAFNYIKEWSME